MGFHHLVAYDHVVGADPAVHTGWDGPYDIDTQFHEPLVLFGYLAGCTNLELVTGILILPQRPTALVAKQAAEVDLLTGAASGWVSASAGTPWSTAPWARTSPPGAVGWRSRSPCSAPCGPPDR